SGQSEFGVSVFLCQVEQTEAGSVCEYGTEPLGVEPGSNLPPLADGNYKLRADIEDDAGFTGTDESTFSINVVAPFVEIRNPENDDVVTRGRLNLRYRVHDASDIEIYLEGPSNPNPAEPVVTRVIDPVEPRPRTYEDSIDLPVDGEHTITVRAIDRNGPHGSAEVSVTFTADSSLPGVVITSPNDNDRNFRSGVDIPLTFTYSEDATVVVALDGQVLVDADPANQPINLGPFDQPTGTVTAHHVKVTVTNDNGSSSDEATFIVDDSPPQVEILSPADGSETTSTTVTLSYTVNDPSNSNEGITSVTVILDRPDNEISQRNGDSITGLSLGEHTVTVQVTDLAGNESDVVSATFTVIEEPVCIDRLHDGRHGIGEHKGKGHCKERRGGRASTSPRN
ncbi:MAG: Ig-like domain-containing protein, partial [SAR324 cluster bacterium]|nr:Ig-like domain-containing protein [SAR324 cluster bacterium]